MLAVEEEQCWGKAFTDWVVGADAQHVSLLLAQGTVLGHSRSSPVCACQPPTRQPLATATTSRWLSTYS